VPLEAFVRGVEKHGRDVVHVSGKRRGGVQRGLSTRRSRTRVTLGMRVARVYHRPCRFRRRLSTGVFGWMN
jgi:hypothetical protein